ncbi:DNA mismatch repair protein MutL [Aciduliprofundum sp. MAR08-339]|uniref:DNA mismatch repair endonuclease MutL n=1 Tax=Aciduliprofundum sp. (strain MAR08-339) TaxID=673860 RepID=UPI0002A480DF|nr:DNA mismatch repair protein MutL [Aciduliprofundum sp. MAR08-339]
MPRIKVLPQPLVEKIAAGEVVERPASVVKELIENSIDAGANRIAVQIRGGGIEEIRVTDNGEGMSREDALLAIKRHATSKISSEEDLNRISTLGFRGEALPSIAAVSKMTIITRRKDEIVGTKLYVKGGELKYVEDTGAPQGTTVLVQNLFFNTPARRKFLKSEGAESRSIYSVVERYALAYENVQFKLTKDGREILNLPPSDLRARISHLWDREIARDMIEIRKDGNMRIIGLISQPYHTRRDKGKIITFINGRYVKSKMLEDAIIEGYGTMLFRDSYPHAVLKIQVPPEDVDVNVHPAKLFVKFKDEKKVKKEISSMIWEALTGVEHIPTEQHEMRNVQVNLKVQPQRQLIFDVEEPKKAKRIEDYLLEMRTLPVEVLGQVDGTYIILKSQEGLLIVDQHAAHERIRYERFLKDVQRGKMQELLEPIVLHLERKDHDALLEMKDALREYGFEIENFGDESIIVRAVPPILTSEDAKEAILEIAAMGPVAIDKRRDEILKLISCKGAIKAHQELSIFEMEKLISELFRCENPYTCPHGRPTIIKFKNEDLEKMFKRKE